MATSRKITCPICNAELLPRLSTVLYYVPYTNEPYNCVIYACEECRIVVNRRDDDNSPEELNTSE